MVSGHSGSYPFLRRWPEGVGGESKGGGGEKRGRNGESEKERRGKEAERVRETEKGEIKR